MEQIGERALAENARGFESQGFGQWAPLSPGYAKRKERKAPGAPIMVLTGTLKDSMIKRGARDNIFEVTVLGVSVGTAVPHAFLHEQGAEGRPARELVFTTPALEAAAVDLAEAYLAQTVSDV